jgi:AAA domain
MTQEQLDEFELEIIQRQIAEETRLQDFISDRCVIDVLAYATSFATAKTLTNIKDIVDDYMKTNPYDLVFYTPIEFPLEDDGVRFE